MNAALKFLGFMALILSICLANGRQIRYSRYTTEITEDNGREDHNIVEPFEIDAIVKEIKSAPYPAAGYRPSKAFPLPTEIASENAGSKTETATDETPVVPEVNDQESFATTTEIYTSDSVTTASTEVPSELNNVRAPYEAAGFKPDIPFNLPGEEEVENQTTTETTTGIPLTEVTTESETTTEVSTAVPLADFTTRAPQVESVLPYRPAKFRPRKPLNLPSDSQVKGQQSEGEIVKENESSPQAPYPPAGFRPSKAFLLPNEQSNDYQNQEDNSKHPVCGSSTNPLAPKPLDGEMMDPDSETIFVNPTTAVVVPVPVNIPAQSLILARPLVYATHIRTW
ncbi:uncharacterized protein LOC142234815 [Haematobia irritans]|uniref:uncharacterized protein LOC142234815 n=1 Tax=Haematobia irritans TaxID=7368 RepID=UPI003F4FF8C3